MMELISPWQGLGQEPGGAVSHGVPHVKGFTIQATRRPLNSGQLTEP